MCGSSPATDCDLLDGIVSMSLAHRGFSSVVLSTQTNSDPRGMNHLLESRIVVKVIVAWSEVWLWGQQAKSDVTPREGHVSGTDSQTHSHITPTKHRYKRTVQLRHKAIKCKNSPLLTISNIKCMGLFCFVSEAAYWKEKKKKLAIPTCHDQWH